MNLDAEDILAEIKHEDGELYARCVLQLQVRMLTADLATKDAEIERLRDQLEEARTEAQLPTRPVGTAQPFVPSYPLAGEEGTRA